MSVGIFLKEFDHVLLDDHRIKLLNMQNYLIKYEDFQQITSIFGKHYTFCLNDETTEGLNTCVCYFIESYKVEFQKLVKLYERLIY